MYGTKNNPKYNGISCQAYNTIVSLSPTPTKTNSIMSGLITQLCGKTVGKLHTRMKWVQLTPCTTYRAGTYIGVIYSEHVVPTKP